MCPDSQTRGPTNESTKIEKHGHDADSDNCIVADDGHVRSGAMSIRSRRNCRSRLEIVMLQTIEIWEESRRYIQIA